MIYGLIAEKNINHNEDGNWGTAFMIYAQASSSRIKYFYYYIHP
jgi:hypothetical protein